MIVHVRTAKVAPGKEQDVLAWAKELNTYIGSKDFNQFDLLKPQFGTEVDRLAFVLNFDSLAAYEQWDQAFQADEGVSERLKAATDLFVPGSLTVQSFQKVEQ